VNTPAVLLISPGILKWTDMDFGLPHLVSIGGYLREHAGVRIEILDLNYEGGDHRSLQRRIEDLGPFLLIGVSLYSSFDYMRVMSLARFLHDLYPDVPLVTGGYHASALPHDVIYPDSPFDAVVVGEGERPMLEMVQTLLGGAPLEKTLYGPDVVPDLDALPPYAWDLLDHYWPRAHDIGRKLQVYLSRGCVYHCTFCMERAKSGYQWRAYSAPRAIDELKRLARKTDLSKWVVNLADPLFGFHREWRREVLQGIIDHNLAPRQYWTLTRSDDLDETDVKLLVKARFSIGIGMETGSPEMLRIMQKGNRPEAYLDAQRRLARLSREHGLNWAANVILGHPGETPESLRQTHSFVKELFTSAPDTCGWVSIDPFRVYPGSQVHETLADYSQRFGTVFHRPIWWKSWYDGPFHAQHVEPSDTVSYEQRVRFMVDEYGPLLETIHERFRGQGRSIDRVYRRSINEQRRILSPAWRDHLLATHKQLVNAPTASESTISVPLGLQIKDPWVRKREEAVRRLLDRGLVRTERLAEALLQTAPERHMSDQAARQVLAGRVTMPKEGQLPPALSINLIARGLEAMQPGLGDTVADATPSSGYVREILTNLVGDHGRALAIDHATLARMPATFDGVWLGAAMPRVPAGPRPAFTEGGRLITFVGPRFMAQDMVCLTRHGDQWDEHRLLCTKVPVLGGRWGWLPQQASMAPAHIGFASWAAPAALFHLLAHLDLGADAASNFDPTLPRPDWASDLYQAYLNAPGRLTIHGMALQHRTLDQLLDNLQSPPQSLADKHGHRLCAMLTAILRTEACPEPQASVALDAAALRPEIQRLRRALYTHAGNPPPLTIVHVPALTGRGRATWRGKRRVVGVDLTQPAQWVAMQVLHEEVHPVTDPLVRAEFPTTHRDTRVGTPGFALHAELERVAVAATQAIIAERLPSWQPAFDAWKAAL
jgi:anaerobic magnesium-protoporphyrin IX monomethyl ester cyclase